MEYHKIDTMFKRDMESKAKKLIVGEWSKPEFVYLANNQWAFTEKVDGTNIRLMFDESGYCSIGGRTDDAQIPSYLLDHLRELLDNAKETIPQALSGHAAIVYGEGYGPKIQGGGKYSQSHRFVVFDVRIGQWWLNRDDVTDIATKLGMPYVPLIGYGTLHDAIATVRKGLVSQWGDFEAEGIVARPVVEMLDRGGRRIITKIKARDFEKLA